MTHATLLPTIVDQWDRQQPHYRLLRNYYDGRHQFPFASQKFARTYQWILAKARENLMPAVVAAFTDVCRIESWTSTEAIDDADLNGITRLAGLVHRETFRAGDAFTLTWPDPSSRARAVFQSADKIVPHVDPANQDVLDWAARVWVDTDTGHGRINVYDAGTCERFVTRLKVLDENGHSLRRSFTDQARSWVAFQDDTGGPVLEHQFGTGPVVWWKRDADDQHGRGRSVLEQAIPAQDELNYHVVTGLISSERIALPIRYALSDAAPNGGVEFDPTKESILALMANQVGQFDGPDADKLLALQTAAEQKIARIVGIPPYVFSQQSADVPSGEALRILNARRTSTVEAFQADATPCWRGQMDLLGHAGVSPVWADPTPHDDAERLSNAVTAKTLGLPVEEWLRTAGLDPSATDAAGATLADRVRAEATQSAQSMAQAFMDGQGAAGQGYTDTTGANTTAD